MKVKTYSKINFSSKVFFLLIFFLFFQNKINSQAPSEPSSWNVKFIIDSLCNQLKKYYVDKKIADDYSAFLQKKYKEEAYEQIRNPFELAATLTRDVLSVNKDEHFHVEYDPEIAYEVSGNVEDIPKMVAEKLEEDKSKNFGFKKMEMLPGGIGYLEISYFARLNNYSKTVADNFLNSLNNAKAIIIDLRYGIGGSPEMVGHIACHFFKTKIHFSSIYIRSENVTVDYFTKIDLSYNTLVDKPLYILCSYKTFSAAEGFIYAMQNLKRATIVGETTRGGAHTVSYRPLGYGFICDIPFGNVFNPVTKKNWEGVGIKPDVSSKSEDALETAENIILDKWNEKAKDEKEKKEILWEREMLSGINHPLQNDSLKFKNAFGKYSFCALSFENGKIFYSKTGQAKFQMIPYSQKKLKPFGNEGFFLEINPEGNQIMINYRDGRKEITKKEF